MMDVTNRKKITAVRDLTTAPIPGSLLAFAVPILIYNILQSVNGSINAMWVGRLLGNSGLAATTNVNLIMFMVSALFLGFGMAAMVLIGQHIGRHDIAAVRRVVGAGIGLFFLIGVAVVICGWFGVPTLLRLLATPSDCYPLAIEYSRMILLGLPGYLLIAFLQMALRGTGDSLTPLLLIPLTAVIDIVLNPVLILGMGPAPRMGIAGSAAAGLIANYIALFLLLYYIYARDLPIRLRGIELRFLIPARDLVLIITRTGIPMGLQTILLTVALLVMIGLVNQHGTATVAAYGAAAQVWTYIQMPAIAIGAAISAMAAQNIGAGHWGRLDKIAFTGVIINLLLTGIMILAVSAPDRLLFSLFLGEDNAAISIAHHINLLASWSFLLSGITIALSAVTRANGATTVPLLIMCFAFIPGRLGTAYVLTPFIGQDAIWWSFPIGYILALIPTVAYYRYGGWRKLKLVSQPLGNDVCAPN